MKYGDVAQKPVKVINTFRSFTVFRIKLGFIIIIYMYLLKVM